MPSKKVISAFIICFALVLTIVIMGGSSPSRNKKVETDLGIISKGPEIKLKENIAWQEEVSNFQISNDEITESGDETRADAELTNLTDQFSQSFFSNYLALKQSGTLDSTSAQNLLDKSTEYLSSQNQTSGSKKYTLKDITITLDNSKKTIENYGNELGKSFLTNKPAGGTKNELEIFNKMVENADSSLGTELLGIASIYKNVALSLSKIIVPSNFSGYHLGLINSMDNISNSVTLMSSVTEDPLKAVMIFKTYENSLNELSRTIGNMRTAILKTGASYKQSDNSYYFFFGI